MRFTRSIRWRLQLWHGVLLAAVLTGFGWSAWRLDRDALFQRVDQDLERRIGAIAESVRRPQPPPQDGRNQPPQSPGDPQQPPPRPDDGRQPPPPRPDDQRRPENPQPSPRRASPPDFVADNGGYYAVWGPGSELLTRSSAAPADLPLPPTGGDERSSRMRGTLREFLHVLPTGERVLVGRDVSDELSASTQFAWLLTMAGAAVFCIGLAVGWWISSDALKPVRRISQTAARIAGGDLSQRVPVDGSGSELDDLARVLNETFNRLQASFERQSQFTADASHELRTPVSVLLTQTQLALSRDRSGAEYRESLEACRRAALRMRSLTEALLMLARLDGGGTADARCRCALDAIGRDATELLQPAAAQANVTVRIETQAVACQGYADQLSAVVTNLVSNAIQYTPSGGTVSVQTMRVGTDAVLVVKDTGIGIAAGDLPHVFERFFRADRSRTSAEGRSGLGLAITKAIVDAHRGRVDVASEVGRGSTFTVTLPAAD